MYKNFLFILLSFFLFACTNPDSVSIPDSVLPEEKMAEMMTDIHLLEATMNIQVGNTDKMGPDGKAINFNIYKKHQVTKEQFEESYKFYTENPELLAEVYQLVLNNLSRMQAEVSSGK